MKSQDTGIVDVQTMPSRAARPRGSRWFAGIGAFTTMVLVAGLGALVFASSGQHRGGQGNPKPTVGEWVQVLDGYVLTSLAAARNDPAVLYGCAIQVQQLGRTPRGSGSSGYMLLRSADLGAHWQDVGSNARLGGRCVFAINPTDGNDIYAVSTPGDRQASNVLKHSTDGGQTWSTITPTLHVPGLQSSLTWGTLQLSMEGNHLFGMQRVPQTPVSLPRRPIDNFPLLRLMMSVDGGRSWTVLDSLFNATRQWAMGYAVDPAHSDTVYELAGVPPFAVQRQAVLPGNEVTATLRYGTEAELYKTTDSGVTWQLLLKGVPIGTQVQLASDKPNLVYAGDTIGTFHLSMSSDGGTTWRKVAIPLQVSNVQRWFVGSNGDVYTDTGSMDAPTATVNSLSSIQRYDPAVNNWSEVTKSPSTGALLAVTPADAHGGAVLWFMGTSNGSEALYRNVV